MKRTLPAIFATCALLASPVHAQKRDAGGDQLETQEAAAENVFKPDAGQETYAPEDDEIDSFVAEKEKQLSTVRQRQIEQMRKILKDKPNYAKRADLLFRLAEKLWDEAKYTYFLERKEYDRKYEAYLNQQLKKKPDEPEADYGEALAEYKKLLKEFPNYERIDEVMFYYGRGLITAGKKKEGASYMLRLTKEYPKSQYVTPAYLAVAEYYFDNDLLFAAKTNYLKVAENKKATEYPYALYKLGYVYYNLREYEDSINSFKQVVDLSKGQDKRKVYFTNQAYSAMTLAYAEVDDGWKRARDYFREVGGDELATNQLESIARIYGKQDKTDEEIQVYEYLITANKQGPKVPEYAENITAAWKKQEDIEKTQEVIDRFLTYFDPKGSWYAVNKEIEEPRIRSNQYREEQTDWLISKFHTKAQEVEKLKDQERADRYYKKAASYYEKYIEWFPQAKDIYEKEFYLAEIYFFQTKEWDKAADHYRAVVKIDPKGKYSQESAYAVILAKEQKMADAGLIERPSRDGKKDTKGKVEGPDVQYTSERGDGEFKPIPEEPLHPAEKEFLEACTAFLDLYPKHEDVPSVSFRSAEIFIKKGHYAEGVKRLEVIMEHHPKHRFAGFAAATLFDANYRLRRWDQMERWARYMLEGKNYKVLNRKQLQDVIAISINNYATELKDAGTKALKDGKIEESRDLKQKAVDQWLRFVKEFGQEAKQQEKGAIALFNAAATTEELEKTEKAIDLYESIIKRYPKSSQATEAHFVLGALYESQTNFEVAADYFEKMASFPEVPQMADALYNAGAIRAALEQYDQAIDIFDTFVEKFPDNPDSRELLLRIAEYQEKQTKLDAALKTYDRYIKKYGSSNADTLVEVYLRRAEVYQELGGRRARQNASKELDKAMNVYKKLPEDGQQKPVVRRAAAQVKFLQAEYVYDDFEAITLEFPMNKLKRGLVRKAELLGKSEALFFEVLEYKSYDVGAGALYRIGESYQLYAQSLFDLPIPAELNEDEQFIYRAELDDVAAPLQEKAIEATRRALDLAHKHHVYNEWSRKAAALLVKLSPEAFPVLDDATNNTDLPVPATFSTTYIADPAGKLEQMVPEPPAAPAAPAPGADPATGATPAAAAPAAEAGAAPAAETPATEAPATGAAKEKK